MWNSITRSIAIVLVLGIFFGTGCQNTNYSVLEDDSQGKATQTKAASLSSLAWVNEKLDGILFFDMAFGKIVVDEIDRNGAQILENGRIKKRTITLPFMVIVLIFGGTFFTLWYRFINIKAFKHSIDIIRGKYDNPEDIGEISHFRALTSALSATIGLGNIAGVAIAIQMGGPGAVFWMVLTAFFGMSAKFSSCTLSQMYRKTNADGTISGGPMYYLDMSMREMGTWWGRLGKVLAVTFAVFAMGGAIGGGNMFQVNQTVEAFTDAFKLSPDAIFTHEEYVQYLGRYPTARELVDPIARHKEKEVLINTYDIDKLGEDKKERLGKEAIAEIKARKSNGASWGIGIIMAVIVGAVILGGIKRIGAVTSMIVPGMVGMYVAASMFIVLSNFSKIPQVLELIFTMAFTKNAFYGGFVGVLVWGIRRASFSNEAGLGSAAIAHAAAKTDEPVREGIVAMIGPFIDTIIVCFMTAMVVIITGAWNDPSIPPQAGVMLTTRAFGSAVTWFPYILTGCIGLFAYSTMISWCYYGERGWIYLLDHINGIGLKTVVVFRLIFVLAILVGAVNTLNDVLAFTDLLILSMAFPNIIGSIILAPKVLAKVKDYMDRYKSGEIKPVTYSQNR